MKTLNNKRILLVLGRGMTLGLSALGIISLSACGVKLGSHIVVGTTSYLEEVNRGTHTESFKEHISGADRARLQAKLDSEVN